MEKIKELVRIKPRHIKILRQLTVAEMTDEEILKAAFDRLKTRAAMLVYDDGERWVFLGRYRKGGLQMLNVLRTAWEAKFGKFKKYADDELD